MKVNGAQAFNHFNVSCHEDYLNKIHLNCTECYFKVIRTCM